LLTLIDRQAVDIVAAVIMSVVMVMAVSRGQVEVAMVPMPVSLADANMRLVFLQSV
jgi:hypothetical protein